MNKEMSSDFGSITGLSIFSSFYLISADEFWDNMTTLNFVTTSSVHTFHNCVAIRRHIVCTIHKYRRNISKEKHIGLVYIFSVLSTNCK
jgi:hypothetical protein